MTRSLAQVAGILALTAALHGCSRSGSGGGITDPFVLPEPETTTVVLDSTQGTSTGGFGFTLTDLSIVGAGGTDVQLQPFASTVIGIDFEFDGSISGGHILGQTDLAQGVYTAVRLTYENARAVLPSGDFIANPSSGTIMVPLRGPLAVAEGSPQVVNLTVDVAITVANVLTGSGFFQPTVFGRCVCSGESIPLAEFDGNVVGVNSTDGFLTVLPFAKGPNDENLVLGSLPVHVTQNTVAIPSDDLPRVVGQGLSALSGIVGEAVEIEATLDSSGLVSATTVESDNVGFQGTSQVQIEGVVVSIGGNQGEPEYGVFVTRIEDDDLGQFPADVDVIPLRFVSAVPRVYFESDQVMVSSGKIRVGMLLEAEGFISGGGPEVHTAAGTTVGSGLGTSGSGGGVGGGTAGGVGHTVLDEDFGTSDPLHFMASSVEVRSQFLFGTVTETQGEGLFEARVNGAESVTENIDLNLLVDSRGVTPLVDGILPIDAADIVRGTEVILFGSFNATAGEFAHPTASMGVPIPTPPAEVERMGNFTTRIMFLRGQEFDGEEIGSIDPANHLFVLTGDARALGLGSPSSLTVFVIREARTFVKGTQGNVVGLSRNKIFEVLGDAANVSLNGYFDRSQNPPIFVATFIEIELVFDPDPL